MEKWSKHATDTLVGQQIETSRIGIDTLAHSGLDWSSYSLTEPGTLRGLENKTLRLISRVSWWMSSWALRSPVAAN